MDNISNLPKLILHDILSKLPEKDAARTSILSKSWKDTWSSFPILLFDEFRYTPGLENRNKLEYFMRKMKYFMRKRREFVDSVDKTLRRFHGQNLAVKQFRLITGPGDDIYTHIDFWMQLLAKSGVHVLDLDHGFYCNEISYRLPRCILEAKSLTKLILSGRFMFDQTLLSPQICLTSLQVSSLVDVQFENERVFHNFISSCPSIEYLTLARCCKLKPIIAVDTLSLVVVHLDFPIAENCTNLRCLSLECGKTTVTDQWFLQLFDRFPLLESLELRLFSLSKMITVTSLQLKVLKLSKCNNCMEVIIDAPRLYLCDFRANYLTMPAITFLNNSSQLEVQAHFQISRLEDFVRLREFLQNFKPKNVLATLTIAIRPKSVHFDIDELPRISVPPPKIKHLELKVSLKSETFCLLVITALLWVCRPTNIFVKLNSKPYNTTFAMVLCEKLVGKDDCCCRPKTIRCQIEKCESSRIQFWWHSLKDVKIRSSSLEGGSYIHYKTLLNALPALPPGEEIGFSLQW